MLFLQGERDQLAEARPAAPDLRRARGARHLHVIPTADHGFHVLKSSGRSDAEVLDELARTVAAWAAPLG